MALQRSGSLRAPEDLRDLIAMDIKNGGTEQSKNDSRDRRRAEYEPVRQDCADHCSTKNRCADELAVRPPEERGSRNFDETCEVSKPLAKSNGVKRFHHYENTGKLCATSADECKGQERARSQ